MKDNINSYNEEIRLLTENLVVNWNLIKDNLAVLENLLTSSAKGRIVVGITLIKGLREVSAELKKMALLSAKRDLLIKKEKRGKKNNGT